TAGSAFTRHHEACAILRPGPVELLQADVLAGALEFLDEHGHEFGDVASSGGGVDAENAGVREAPMKRIYRIAEPAFLAHSLKKPGRHAPAEDHGKHLRGVEVAHVIGAPLEAKHDLGVHQVAGFAIVATRIGRLTRLLYLGVGT